MHTPDLNLASSYIPACLCCGKSLGAFICFIFSPVRGWIALGSVLCADRILWNRPNPIMDVNAVCTALIAGLMVAHTRLDGIKSTLEYAVIIPWMLFGALQVVGASRMPKSYEIVYAACALSLLSCTHQPRDENEVVALRSLVFVLANIALSYVGIMLGVEDGVDTYVYVSRTFLILLGDWRVATAWVALYMVCVGYHFRKRRSPTKQQPEPCQDDTVRSTAEEAGLLREALARKGYSVQ
jgi:hypothetical protein